MTTERGASPRSARTTSRQVFSRTSSSETRDRNAACGVRMTLTEKRERMAVGKRFGVQHVERGAGDPAGHEGRGEGVGVDGVPRAASTRNADGFIAASAAASTILRVSSERTQCSET